MLKLNSLIFFLFCITHAIAQIKEIPLAYNQEILAKKDYARDGEDEIIKLFLPLNRNVVFCPEPIQIPDSASRIDYTTCQSLRYGTIEFTDSCVTYFNHGNIGTDILCLQICDSNDQCLQYELHFIAGDILLPPFIDDFAYDGPFPDQSRWLDQDVYINTTLAQDPISIGVATFDGLDQTGTPYPGGPGYSDFLTSTFIDLTRFDDVYFSFFAQPKGLGIKPRIRDSLMIDFKNEQGNWVRVYQLEGLPNSYATKDPAPEFAFHEVPVKAAFRHDAFQFRFRNKSKNLGLQEFWHLDYVRVGNRNNTSQVFRDVAFTHLPTPIIHPYSSMPATHFSRDLVRSTIESQLYNFNSGNQQIDNPIFTVLDQNGAILFSRTFIEPVSKWNLPSQRTLFDFPLDQSGDHNYQAVQDAVESMLEGDKEVEVQSRLSFDLSSEILSGGSNNRVEKVTKFSNYFAYDDGTAESAIVEQGEIGSTTLALEFEATIADTLKGVQFLFPHIEGDEGSLRFSLFVWLDSLDDEPEFAQNFISPVFTDQLFDTLQGFTTYDLRDEDSGEKTSLFIPAGKFYIGFIQINTASTVKIPVGYDLNSPDGHPFFYFNNGNGWASAGANVRKGSLMIRPVVGREEVISTPVIDIKHNQVKIYPNPVSRKLFIDYHPGDHANWSIKLIHSSGTEQYASVLSPTLDIGYLPTGLYATLIYDASGRLQQSTKMLIIR